MRSSTSLQRERDAFFAMLDTVEPESMTTPGLVGEWSGRELIAHVGYWTGHATEVIHLSRSERIRMTTSGGQTVDEVNATVAADRRATHRWRRSRSAEAASVEALVSGSGHCDAALLREVLPDGATLEPRDPRGRLRPLPRACRGADGRVLEEPADA
jgi:hypothetical protein